MKERRVVFGIDLRYELRRDDARRAIKVERESPLISEALEEFRR